MTRGGKREGAGRKLTGLTPAKPRTIRATDEQWQAIKAKAQDAGMNVTEYILTKALHE